jgi:hypothetical protein
MQAAESSMCHPRGIDMPARQNTPTELEPAPGYCGDTLFRAKM